MADETRATAALLYELGLLKRFKRTGWEIVGVPEPESVADHSFRAAITAAAIAAGEGADPHRAAFLALWHDSQETRTTDIPHHVKPYVTVEPNEKITEDQTRELAPTLATVIRTAVGEYESKESPEARCARDADKLECLFQACECRAQGHDTKAWIDSSLAALTTPTAKQIADEALNTGPLRWRERIIEER